MVHNLQNLIVSYFAYTLDLRLQSSCLALNWPRWSKVRAQYFSRDGRLRTRPSGRRRSALRGWCIPHLPLHQAHPEPPHQPTQSWPWQVQRWGQCLVPLLLIILLSLWKVVTLPLTDFHGRLRADFSIRWAAATSPATRTTSLPHRIGAGQVAYAVPAQELQRRLQSQS